MKADPFSFAMWTLLAAFVTSLVYQQLFKPSALDLVEQTQRLEKAKSFRIEHERVLSEKIRLCAMNAPQTDCERVFRCDDDPCYCSACD